MWLVVDKVHAQPHGPGPTVLSGAARTGVADVQASVDPLLKQHLADSWCLGGVWPKPLQLRLFAVTAMAACPPADAGQAAAAPVVAAAAWTSSDTSQFNANGQGTTGANGTCTGTACSSSSSSNANYSSGTQPEIMHSIEGNDSNQQPQQELVQVWAELWVKGLPPAACKAAAQHIARHLSSSTQAGLDDSASPQCSSAGRVETDPSPYAANAKASAAAAIAGRRADASLQQHTAGSWLPQRRRDVAELLLRHGLAHLAEPEDCEWLGIRQARWQAYQR
jgi:hypothetical protein